MQNQVLHKDEKAPSEEPTCDSDRALLSPPLSSCPRELSGNDAD